ncbi:hypothetical protein CRE_01948 [Caenorhabditis remanei]|uniref:Argonaute protein hrde-1/Nuclear RNAi defective-3 protein-like N-terminal domain-containing protein n=1 Tax=Caenorhabditis remanei TaxID=31234 RepID=E3LGG3_CAERE|nr:hypothetical protein CRE_01948 [Caenorhabditis remanei]
MDLLDKYMGVSAPKPPGQSSGASSSGRGGPPSSVYRTNVWGDQRRGAPPSSSGSRPPPSSHSSESRPPSSYSSASRPPHSSSDSRSHQSSYSSSSGSRPPQSSSGSRPSPGISFSTPESRMKKREYDDCGSEYDSKVKRERKYESQHSSSSERKYDTQHIPSGSDRHKDSFSPITNIPVRMNSWRLDITEMDEVIQKVMFKTLMIMSNGKSFDLADGIVAVSGE